MARIAVRLGRSLLVCLLLSSSAHAATLSGRVVDPDGRPVPGATVLAVAAGQPLRSTHTGAGGEFTLDVPDGTSLDLRVALPGFRSANLRVEAAADRSVGEIRLAVGAVSEAVVVSAAQVEIPLSEASSSVTIVDRSEIEARQLHSVADALRSVPGLTVAATGGVGAVTGVFPRGGESNFTLVLIDDVPANAFGGEFDFASLSTESVERIEIVRGPQSALFGSNAIGSVVRIVTRRGGAPTASATVERGGYDTLRAAAATSGSAGRFEWGASVERLGSEGYNGERTSDGLIVENDDYERTAGTFSGGWRAGSLTIRGHLRHAVDDRGNPGPFGSNPVGAYGGIDTISRGENGETTGSLSTSFAISPRVRSTVQAGYHRLESDFASPFGDSASHSRRLTGRVQVDVTPAAPLELTFGTEWQRERAGSTFITDDTFNVVPVKRTVGGYFGELRWNHQRRLLVTGGIRLDDIRRDPLGAAAADEDHVVSVNPRIAAAWLVRGDGTNGTKIRASAATGIRPPGAFDIAFTDNPSLKPERSVSAEAGVEQALFGGRARIDAAAFYNRYDELIIAVGSFAHASRYTTDNISNARARGLELGLSAAHRVAARRPVDLHARLGYTFLDSDVLAVDSSDEAPPPFTVGDPLIRRPRHQVSADITVRSGALTAFVSGRARGRALDVEPSLGTFGGLHVVAGFSTWDAGVAWRLAPMADLFGRIENAFDRTYEEALGFPALGRRVTLGVRVAAGR